MSLRRAASTANFAYSCKRDFIFSLPIVIVGKSVISDVLRDLIFAVSSIEWNGSRCKDIVSHFIQFEVSSDWVRCACSCIVLRAGRSGNTVHFRLEVRTFGTICSFKFTSSGSWVQGCDLVDRFCSFEFYIFSKGWCKIYGEEPQYSVSFDRAVFGLETSVRLQYLQESTGEARW